MTEKPGKKFEALEAPSRDLKKHAVRGGGATILSQLVRLVVQMTTFIVFARLLTPADFGIVAMAAPISALAILLRDLGLTRAVVQKSEISPSEINSLFWANAFISIFLALLCVALAPVMAWFYGENRTLDIALAFSLMVLAGGLSSLHVSLLTRQMRLVRLATIETISLALAALIALVWAFTLRNYWAIVLLPLLNMVISNFLLFSLSGWRPGKPVSWVESKSLLIFGRAIALSRILEYLANALERILLGKVWGDVELGLYDRGQRLVQLPSAQIQRPLGRVSAPLLSRLQNEHARYRQAFQQITTITLLVMTPGLVFLAMTVEKWITMVLGAAWENMVPIVVWLAIAALSRCLIGSVGWLYFSQGRSRAIFRISILQSSILILGILAGLPWGAEGIAIAAAVASSIILMPLQIWYATRVGAVTLGAYIQAALPVIAALACVAGLILAAESLVQSWPPLAVIALFCACYGLALLVVLLFPQGRKALLELATILLARFRKT